MITTCSGTHGCGKSWGGKRASHCTARGCHQTFSADSIGDAHRVGPHDGHRRCLTGVEMLAKGWRLVNDVWRGPAMPTDLLSERKEISA